MTYGRPEVSVSIAHDVSWDESPRRTRPSESPAALQRLLYKTARVLALRETSEIAPAIPLDSLWIDGSNEEYPQDSCSETNSSRTQNLQNPSDFSWPRDIYLVE